MALHQLRANDRGEVDHFALDYDGHNGPACVVCRRCWCEHCEPELAAEECAGPQPPPMGITEGDRIRVEGEVYVVTRVQRFNSGQVTLTLART